MNAFQQAEQLKLLSDQQLSMVRGQMPEFLLVAELQRREQMRKAYEADQMQAQKGGRTVSDEMWSSVAPPVPPPMGGPSPQMQGPGPSPSPVPAPQMMQPQQPMSMGGMVQRLAQGGMVRYAEGGAMAAIQRILGSMQQPRSLGDYMGDVRSVVGDDQLSPIMAEMAAQRATPAVGKPSPWQALMRMGAGMMASRNPTPMGGLGEGLTQALNGYSQDRAAYQADQIRMQEMQQRMLAQRAQLAGAMNDRNMGMARLGASLRGDDAAIRNTNLGLMGNAALADAAQDRAIMLENLRTANEAKDPYRIAMAKKAMADAALDEMRKAEIEKMGGEFNYQVKLRNATREPHVYSAMDQLIFGARAGNQKDAELLDRLRGLESKQEETDRKLLTTVLSETRREMDAYRDTVQGQMAKPEDLQKMEAIVLQRKAAVLGLTPDRLQKMGVALPSTTPVAPPKLGIKLNPDGTIAMPQAQQKAQPVTGPFRVNLEQFAR